MVSIKQEIGFCAFGPKIFDQNAPVNLKPIRQCTHLHVDRGDGRRKMMCAIAEPGQHMRTADCTCGQVYEASIQR